MQTKGTKFEETAIIIRQEEIADDIYSMWLRTEHIAAHAKAGQFVSVYCNEAVSYTHLIISGYWRIPGNWQA